jgi:hypothetical protein
MGKIILPYVSSSVYLRWPFGSDTTRIVIFPSKMLCAIQLRPSRLSSQSKNPRKPMATELCQAFLRLLVLAAGVVFLNACSRDGVTLQYQTSRGKHGQKRTVARTRLASSTRYG